MNERGLVDLFSAMNSLTGSALECPHYPCHFEGQDCSLCYCIFYPCFIYKFGDLIVSSKGNFVWSCKKCEWVHRKENVEEIVTYFSSFPRQILVEA
ncbi:MAG: cysteine-rich small domain-containing protein, partial [Archaeoglobaceae archaeon]